MKLEQLGPDQAEALLPLVREYHAFEGIDMPESVRRRTLERLLDDPRLGAVWAVVEQGQWVGYAALTFGYSIEFRGRDAFIDEIFIREDHRGRGIGTRVLELVKGHAARLGAGALHLEADRNNRPARKAYARAGFQPRGRFSLMSIRLASPGDAEE